jgi:hypothetical protein
MNGLWFIRGNLLRDIAALNKLEILPWDIWGIAEKRDRNLTADDHALLDTIAALTVAPAANFAAIRHLYQTDSRLTMPVSWPREHGLI